MAYPATDARYFDTSASSLGGLFVFRGNMKIGTKSILIGAHQFMIHPWFVAVAWWRLYGFPWDPRLWVAFFVHDIGYWGKPNMDGPEGDWHVKLGAEIMGFLFDRFGERRTGLQGHKYHVSWYCFCFYHSRFMAKKYGILYSRLCVADKLAIALEPWWLYLPRVILSGEIKEYMKAVDEKYKNEPLVNTGKREWFDSVKKYLFKWVNEHRDIKEDIWTIYNGKT